MSTLDWTSISKLSEVISRIAESTGSSLKRFLSIPIPHHFHKEIQKSWISYKGAIQCIADWFYTADLAKMATIEEFFVKYPDKHAEPIVVVLINRACGKA
ncbi:MAG: hypothetical protein AAGD92_03215 [Pseudomonadota bacterium]